MASTRAHARRQYVCIYRLGNRESFSWHRGASKYSRIAADSERTRHMAAGRYAMVVDYALSMSIGLPETYGGDVLERSIMERRATTSTHEVA